MKWRKMNRRRMRARIRMRRRRRITMKIMARNLRRLARERG
jgi:hypothetical protein